MDKVSLAKKTAKLMVDKLSPQELENELYQLLIMLPDSDLDYVHDDVESGSIAGPLINNPQDTEEYLRTSTYVEGDAVTTEDKVEKIIRKLYDEEYITFAKYLEGSDLVRQIDIDDNGVVNIYWTDVQMGGYITQATPFWADVDEIPVQVETTMGVLIDNGGNPVSVSFPTSLYIDEGFNQFMMSYYDKLPEILAKSKSIVDEYEGFQEDQQEITSVGDINYNTDIALSQWDNEGADFLTDTQKELIYYSDGVHTDYGWNQVVNEWKRLFAKPEYQMTSLDDIPQEGWDLEQDMEEAFKSQMTNFQNEFDFEKYYVDDYYDENLKMKDWKEWHI